MSKLHLSKELSLPIDAVTQKFGILGRTGSGKSYGATKLAEEMLDRKAQIVALDPIGVWWGLRVAADGKAPGYSIPVFGGTHGDIPLEPTGGALIADIIVDYGTSAVVDLSNFLLNEQRKFATDFATQLFHRKKTQRSPVHVFFEEAQEFVPQQVRGDVTRMVGAFERLIKLGRNFGIGATLISQRPQSVNKDVLNQTECLLAFQMTGPQERKTIENWIAEKGVDEDIASVLPHLKVGQCHIWSPQWLQISMTIKIDKKKTADVSSTPQHGSAKKIEPKELSESDLAGLREKMAATIERAKLEDPKALRAQLSEVRGQLSALQKKTPAAKIEIKEKPVLKDSQITRIEKWADRCEKYFSNLREVLTQKFVELQIEGVNAIAPVREAVGKLEFANTEPRSASPSPAVAKRIGAAEGPARDGHKPLMRNRSDDNTRSPIGNTAGDTISGDCALTKKVERALLTALAQRADKRLTKQQVLIFADYRRSGDTDQAFRKFIACGFAMDLGNELMVTEAGITAVSPFTPLPTGEALRSQMLNDSRLKKVERELLRVLFDAYPDWLSKTEALDRANYKRSGDTDQAFRKFVTAGWAQIYGARLRASYELFEAT